MALPIRTRSKTSTDQTHSTAVSTKLTKIKERKKRKEKRKKEKKKQRTDIPTCCKQILEIFLLLSHRTANNFKKGFASLFGAHDEFGERAYSLHYFMLR